MYIQRGYIVAYEGTTVSVSKSMGDISAMVISRDGQFIHAISKEGFMVEINLPLDYGNNFNTYIFKQYVGDAYLEAYKKKHPKVRKDDGELLEQERRRRARILLNYLKNLFEAVDTGLLESEAALLGFMQIPGSDSTVYEIIGKRLKEGNLSSGGLL
ncbi:unnamed protein product, partial [marine sediment metagenome]